MAWLQSFFGSHEAVSDSKEATAVDVITYVASLVSTPQAIDPILDTVREISSRITPGQALTKADEAALGKVYREIEHYLVEQDPIRTFTVQELRQRVSDRFPHIAHTLIGVPENTKATSQNTVE